jgi:hypothetical protein
MLHKSCAVDLWPLVPAVSLREAQKEEGSGRSGGVEEEEFENAENGCILYYVYEGCSAVSNSEA